MWRGDRCGTILDISELSKKNFSRKLCYVGIGIEIYLEEEDGAEMGQVIWRPTEYTWLWQWQSKGCWIKSENCRWLHKYMRSSNDVRNNI